LRSLPQIAQKPPEENQIMGMKLARKIVRIDEEKCNGCGQCVPSCAEGAIQIVGGKARLVGESLCDGLGACLGECPMGAIIIEERPADAFDPEAVEKRKQAPARKPGDLAQGVGACAGSCPGSTPRELRVLAPGSLAEGSSGRGSPAQASGQQLSPAADKPVTADAPSRLAHWPVQLALVPPAGPMWQGTDVLIAADCVPFALPDFHEKLLRGKSLAVACPKLDDVRPYLEKLTRIFTSNDVRSVTVAHMEVPCCWGIVQVVRKALEDSGRRDIPLHDITVAVGGAIL
jgi:ferredoxin